MGAGGLARSDAQAPVTASPARGTPRRLRSRTRSLSCLLSCSLPTRSRAPWRVRDLTHPCEGPHAIQRLTDDVTRALARAWRCEVRVHRGPAHRHCRRELRRARLRADAVTRDARYTRVRHADRDAAQSYLRDGAGRAACDRSPHESTRSSRAPASSTAATRSIECIRVRRTNSTCGESCTNDTLTIGDLKEMVEIVVGGVAAGRRVARRTAFASVHDRGSPDRRRERRRVGRDRGVRIWRPRTSCTAPAYTSTPASRWGSGSIAS